MLLLAGSIPACSQAEKVKATSPVQPEVDAVAAKLGNGEIGRIEIFQIPDEVLTRTRITPEMLERQFDYRLTIRDVRGGAYQQTLTEIMRSIAVQPTAEMADLRWGVIFYNIDESRALSLYFDKSGSNGAVGMTPVAFKGDLFKWLHSNFSNGFR
jgi:hypothetical protein